MDFHFSEEQEMFRRAVADFVGKEVIPAAASVDERPTLARACASDIDRFCPGVPRRQVAIKACLSPHMTELLAGCFDAVMGAGAAEQAP